MAFVKVAKLADVPEGTVRVRRVGDREIALCNVDGEIYAIDNVCTHDEGSLDQGELDAAVAREVDQQRADALTRGRRTAGDTGHLERPGHRGTADDIDAHPSRPRIKMLTIKP